MSAPPPLSKRTLLTRQLWIMIFITMASLSRLLWGHHICHNGFPLDLDDLKNTWSRHRSFLYACDRSPGIHFLKLGIEIPNLKRNAWSAKMDFKIPSPGVQLRVRRISTLTTSVRKTIPIRHMLSSKFNEHAFIYCFLSLSKMRCPILTNVFRAYLIDNPFL